MSIIKRLIGCLYQASINTVRHDGIEHAGYMAFLSLLALFPFLVFLVAVTGFFGASEIGVKLSYILMNNLPTNVSAFLEPRIAEITSGPPQGLMTLAIVGAIWTASSSVEGWRTILNRIYHISTPPAYILRRLLSIAQFLLLTLFILLAIFLLILAPIMWDKICELLNIATILNPLWNKIRYLIVLFSLWFFAATLYYMIPNVKLKFRSVISGSILAMILWTISAMLLSAYISKFKQVNLIYGSLGGIIITLVFFYIINMIFIYGAEFNYLVSKEFRHR
jgi:membrane protein